MSARRLAGVVFPILAIWSASGRAWAEDDPSTLKFAEGSTASGKHDWARAEALFQESIRLKPSVGAYFNRGYCLEQLGRFSEAYRDYREAERLAKLRDDARAAIAHESALRMVAKVHFIEVDVPASIANAPGLRVVVDGVELPQSVRQEQIVSETNTHTVTVTARDHAPWTRSDIPDHAKVVIELGPPARSTPERMPATSPASNTGMSTYRLTGIIAAGAGVATLAASGVIFLTGASTLSDLKSTRDGRCAGSLRSSDGCFAADTKAHQYRSDLATTTTVMDIVGAVLLAGGAGVYFLAPSAHERVNLAPAVGPRAAGLSVMVPWR